MFGLSRNLYQISQFIIKIVILEVPGQIRILPPQPKRKETPCASLFVLLMENLHQRPPEEVVGSSGAAPPGADAAAALDPQPRHWRAAAHKPGPGMAARQGGSNPSPATIKKTVFDKKTVFFLTFRRKKFWASFAEG